MRKKIMCFPFLVLALIFCFNAESYAVSFTFDSGFDGWTPTVPAETTWQANGGNPNGYIRIDDISGSSGQVLAPSGYLGDWSGLDGVGAISFDHKLFSTGYIGTQGIFDYEINLSGSGNSAQWTSTGPSGATDWLTLTALLDESDWMVSGSWSTLLASVSELRIRIELVDNGGSTHRDIAGIDNIVLPDSTTPIPEPATMLLLGGGLIGMFGWRKRKEKV